MHVSERATVDVYNYAVGLARAGLKNVVCCTEMIDNALDAKATFIQLFVRPDKEFRIQDNGSGVPDIRALVRFGGHVSHGRGGSGMYGIGLKEAALVLGGESSRVVVSTRFGGRRFVGAIDWQRLKDEVGCLDGDWADDPNAVPGTEISIQPLRRKFPEGKDRDDLLRQLGYIYSPALKDNKAVIQFTAGGKTHTIERWPLPTLEDVIDVQIDIGGKRARLFAGIVATGEKNERPGITYSHGFRVIKVNGAAGCGTWGVNRICGFVKIDERRGWHRTKNKTDLVDAEDLYEEVERHLTPLLKKAATQSHSIAFEGNRSALAALLASAILGVSDQKAVREPGEKTGSQQPTGKGGKHSRAKETQPGATFGRRRASSICLDFIDGWTSGAPFGKWHVENKIARVTLYQDHPLIKFAMAPWNNHIMFLAAMAVASIAHNGESSDQGALAAMSSHDILIKLAEYTSKVASLDGQRIGVCIAQAAE